MPDTIDVKDAGGVTVTIPAPAVPGRASAANSRPVALSTEDLAALNAITAKLSEDPASQTTLAAILAALASVAVTGPLTDEQLRATAVPVSLSGGATSAKQDAQTAAVNLVGTRAYGTIERVASGAASAQSGAITATEILLHASKRCYVLAGSNPTASATIAIPLEAGEKFHMRITSGHKIAVIRDTEDGYLHIAAVA